MSPLGSQAIDQGFTRPSATVVSLKSWKADLKTSCPAERLPLNRTIPTAADATMARIMCFFSWLPNLRWQVRDRRDTFEDSPRVSNISVSHVFRQLRSLHRRAAVLAGRPARRRAGRSYEAVGRVDALYDEPKPGAPRTLSDAAVESTFVATLEITPKGRTHARAAEDRLSPSSSTNWLLVARHHTTARAIGTGSPPRSSTRAADRMLVSQ